MATIPASEIVSVAPGVLSAGGTALDLNGLLLTTSARPPIGAVPAFATADDVASYFGPSSTEAALADVYFAGFDGSNVKPGAMLFAQYPTSPVAAFLRGGSSGLTVAGIQAIKPASVTGSIGGSVTATAGATFTGSAAGTVLTASAVTGIISVGDVITGTGYPAGTFVASLGSGTGGSGTYNTNQATTASAAASTATSSVLNVTAVGSGTLQPGDAVSGTGVTGSTTVLSQLTGSAGSTGTYRLSVAQQFASATVTSLSTTLKVTAVGAGALAAGLLLSGTNVASGSRVVSQISGTAGAAGLYVVSLASTTVSETIVGAYDLTVSVNGSPATSASVDLSAATSFSGAATTIGSAISQTVTYDSVAGAFVVTSPTTGSASAIGFGSGGLAVALFLTSALGAVASQGSNAATPAAFMNGVKAVTQNWALFTTAFDPDVSGCANKLLFSAWADASGDRYGYVGWDTDLSPTQSTAATNSFGYQAMNDSSGTLPVYNTATLAVFVLAWAASLDFGEHDGRATLAFRKQTGLSGVPPLVPSVTDATAAANLIANGYDFYGDYATAADDFRFMYPGSVTGAFKWADTFVNQIWLNSACQLALLTLLTTVKSIPYNNAGYTLIAAALADPIAAALNFGAIRANVPLSALQAAEVNQAAGAKISDVLGTRGWYLQVSPASAQTRVARGSPPCTLWYMDGGSVQKINLASIEVQ